MLFVLHFCLQYYYIRRYIVLCSRRKSEHLLTKQGTWIYSKEGNRHIWVKYFSLSYAQIRTLLCPLENAAKLKQQPSFKNKNLITLTPGLSKNNPVFFSLAESLTMVSSRRVEISTQVANVSQLPALQSTAQLLSSICRTTVIVQFCFTTSGPSTWQSDTGGRQIPCPQGACSENLALREERKEIKRMVSLVSCLSAQRKRLSPQRLTAKAMNAQRTISN